ncbi:TIGR04282 family arsenosugar biosynthesis glycosyltransferase [Winogradskyella sp. 4-2091]|uniref:TIGR04282 family arsenosugar biosynthesis glycosyltransferase n=1 Tax=Winogradskyella sp. 4-2091 TaxID=3381659 RepID=UPI0038929B69
MNKNALIIFTRNPELGKCKTRLAKTIGDQNALDIYKYLLQHTANISQKVNADIFVFYSENISTNDLWHNDHFIKKLQSGSDLGERMQNAFKDVFNSAYEKAVIIGSDLLDLNEFIIDESFKNLENQDFVIGPAEDGGYYLLGMKHAYPEVFNIQNWGGETVYEQTINKLNDKSVYVLKTLNDIDNVEDLKPYKVFEKYLTNHQMCKL